MPADRLGDLLVRMGALTQPELDHALSLQLRHRVRLGQILVDHGLVPEQQVVAALAQLSGLPRLDLHTQPIDATASRWIPREWAEQHMIVPLVADRRTRTLTVASSDPTDVGPLDELAFRTGLEIKAVVASDLEVAHLLRHLFHGAALVRDRAQHVRRPARSSVPAPDGPEETPEVWHGHDEVRAHVQRDSNGPRLGALSLPQAPAGPPEPPLELTGATPATPVDRALVPRLRALLDAQQSAARELQVLFELCVAHGIIQRQEYLERLQQDDGA